MALNPISFLLRTFFYKTLKPSYFIIKPQPLRFFSTDEAEINGRKKMEEEKEEEKEEVQMVHQWPEWVDLMERLVKQNYFDRRRRNEDRMVHDSPIDDDDQFSRLVGDDVYDYRRDWRAVRTACQNFARDRFDILRSLLRKDIQILVGHGCPSVDTKVVLSAKLLRKFVLLDEGDVCSSCCLRSSCNSAYLPSRIEGEARTVDLMRILMGFGFDPVLGLVENKSLLKLKSVKLVVRKLLHEVGKLSAIPIDPYLTPPPIKKTPFKVKRPPNVSKERVRQGEIGMDKSGWLCSKCDFMNFAKNTVCLRCDAQRLKRPLLPGEWECPKCNFLNYSRNMACFHCDQKRPLDDFTENHLPAKPHGCRTRLERAASMPGVSNAWNFNFDDNESDGAEVAAFEYGDPPIMCEDSSLHDQAPSGSSRGYENSPFDSGKIQYTRESVRCSESDQRNPTSLSTGMGFNDLDDEDDNVNGCVLDAPNNNSIQELSSKNFPLVGRSFESEGIDDSNNYFNSHREISSNPYYKPSQLMRRTASFSGSEDYEQEFDSKKELPVHPKWKPRYIADSRRRTRGRDGSGSDKEPGLNSDRGDDIDQHFRHKRDKESKHFSTQKGYRREGGSYDSEDGLPFDSESNNDGKPQSLSHRDKLEVNRAGLVRRGKAFKGSGQSASARDSRFISNDIRSERRYSFNNCILNGSSRSSRRKD